MMWKAHMAATRQTSNQRQVRKNIFITASLQRTGLASEAVHGLWAQESEIVMEVGVARLP
jgi:hypothetical protein